MYIDRNPTINKSGNKSRRAILRHSYRKDGKIKKKTIANLSALADDELDAIELALKNKGNISNLTNIGKQCFEADKSFGTFDMVMKVLEKLKFNKVLENSKQKDIFKWLIYCRLVHQSSVNEAFKLKDDYYTKPHLDLDNCSLKDFYNTYDWIYKNQKDIEDKLFRKQKKQTETIFLYDVTSSYLEGLFNELSDYGYNRDKKKGKKQIVYGLLTDSSGDALSVEGFKGNTNDTKTFSSQINLLKKRFNCRKITMVGDKGMIKSAQIEEIEKNGFYYLTTITKKQIKSKVKKGVFQLSLFEDELVDLCNIEEKVRYVLRRNPVRAQQIRDNRKQRFELIKIKVKEANQYLEEHPKAKTETQFKRINGLINKYKFSKWLFCKISQNGNIELQINISEIKQIMYYDGCYAIKTNLIDNEITTDQLHNRYKDLSKVEQAFRTEKTVFLKVRPLYLRKEVRTRAHLFIVMMAYKVYQYIFQCWEELNITVKEGLFILNQTQTINVKTQKKSSTVLLEPNQKARELIKALKITKPKI